MAWFECHIFSQKLFRSATVNVTLPTPDSNDSFFNTETHYPRTGEKYPVLWLLHGISADETDWQRFSSIERYAQEKKIAVIMPDAYNSMYANNQNGGDYFDYITEELPMAMRALLPISAKREHNFIAGLSMGGGGAFKAALLKPECYAAAASLSGGLIQEEAIGAAPSPIRLAVERWQKNSFGANREFYNPKIDDLKLVLKTDVEKGVNLPKLYICCGTEDFIYPSNVAYRDYARSLGVEITYDEGAGVHNFDFWDSNIRKILNWLPLTGTLVD